MRAELPLYWQVHAELLLYCQVRAELATFQREIEYSDAVSGERIRAWNNKQHEDEQAAITMLTVQRKPSQFKKQKSELRKLSDGKQKKKITALQYDGARLVYIHDLHGEQMKWQSFGE